MDTAFSKRKRPSSLLTTLSSKPASLIVCGYTSDYGIGSLRFWKVTISAERYCIYRFCSNKWSRWSPFQGLACLFELNNAKLHTASATGFVVEDCWRCWTDLSPVQNNQVKTFYISWNEKYNKEHQGLFSSKNQISNKKLENIPLPEVHVLVTSVPRCLRTLVKRRNAT